MIGVNSYGAPGIGLAISINQVRPFLTAVSDGAAAQEAFAVGPGHGQVSIDGPTVQGQLNQSSPVLPDGSLYTPYVLDGQVGQSITVDMISRDFDAYLILLYLGNPAIYIADNDSGGQSQARLIARLPFSGRYLLLANTFARGELGCYQLSIASNYLLEEVAALGPGNPTLEDGTYYQEYAFEGQAGQIVRISLESDDFDAYLVLLDARHRVIVGNDDISPDNSNSRLVLTLPYNGRYYIVVNTYDSQEQGRYRLTVE